MEDLKKFESALEAKLAEQKAEVAANTEKAAKAFESRIEQINEELVKANKTAAEARNEVLEAKASFGKLQAKESAKVATSYGEHIFNIKEILN